MKRLEARFTQMIPWNQYWSSFDFILKKQLLCFHDKYFLNFITGVDNQKKKIWKKTAFRAYHIDCYVEINNLLRTPELVSLLLVNSEHKSRNQFISSCHSFIRCIPLYLFLSLCSCNYLCSCNFLIDFCCFTDE